MSLNIHPQRKFQFKSNQKYYLSSNKNNLINNINKSQKRAISQKKFMPSDIITQVSASNLYLNNIYSSNSINANSLHHQAFTPIIRNKKLYEDDFLIPKKSTEFKDKKTLVLDLDETLVHSSFFPFAKNDIVLNIDFDGVFYNIYVLVRPWAEEFIQEMAKYFEIIVFTASIASYASPLLDILDKGKNIKFRLYREQCNFINGMFIKDLKRLNRNLKDVIIVDNSPLAYAFDVDNGLPILSWFDNREDKELLYFQPLLKFLAKVDDVRKYIKKFIKNNSINYEIANKIIKKKNNEENKNKEKNNLGKNNNLKEEEKGENTINENNNSSKKENSKNKVKNLNENNINLLNNYIAQEDINNIPNFINDDIKNNNINNILKLDNKINNISIEKKSIKLKLQNNNNNNNFVKSFNIDNKKNNNNKKNKNIEKKNIFRFGLNNRKNNNNISPINNNIKPHLKLKNFKESNYENDIKINENLVIQNILPLVPKTSKDNNNLVINNNKNIFSKSIQNQSNNATKVSKNNSIERLSLKKTINFNYNMNPSSQFKYLNLMEKFQENNNKSSSLKLIKDMKNDMKIDNKRRSAKFKMNNNSIKNNKNKMSLRNRLRLSSRPVNNLKNNNLDLNNLLNKNKVTDMYSHALRSKSTANFVKLKSAHPRTPKTMNKMLNSNINKINSEDNKNDFFKK